MQAPILPLHNIEKLHTEASLRSKSGRHKASKLDTSERRPPEKPSKSTLLPSVSREPLIDIFPPHAKTQPLPH